jgi:hypothetical protein
MFDLAAACLPSRLPRAYTDRSGRLQDQWRIFAGGCIQFFLCLLAFPISYVWRERFLSLSTNAVIHLPVMTGQSSRTERNMCGGGMDGREYIVDLVTNRVCLY